MITTTQPSRLVHPPAYHSCSRQLTTLAAEDEKEDCRPQLSSSLRIWAVVHTVYHPSNREGSIMEGVRAVEVMVMAAIREEGRSIMLATESL